MGSDWVNGWSMGSDSIDTKLTWTPRGQLASMKKGSGEAGVKSSIKHLSMNSGQLTSMTYPSGRKLHYSYNAMGRIAKITITAGGQTQVLAKDIAYLPFGGITGLDYGNGTHLSQTYNQDYRLTKTETSNGFSRKYTYDADGNATVLTNTVSRPATPMAVSMAPDSNHIQSLSLNGGPYNPVTYDAAGRTVRQAGLKYVYYPSGRLFAVQSENADGSAQSLAAYAYSGLGRRVVTVRLDTPAQQTRHFMYDAAGHLIGVYQADGAPVHEIAYLNGRPLALFKGGNIYTIQTDRKDTPREIANAQGDVIWYLGGSAFDNFVVLYPQDVTIKLHLHLRFPGQYFDPASGNHYNGHRYYVPTTGRYLTPDPIGLAGGINPYRYVGDNPVNSSDPSGLLTFLLQGEFAILNDQPPPMPLKMAANLDRALNPIEVGAVAAAALPLAGAVVESGIIPAATEVGAEACGVATTAVQHAPEIGRTSLLLGSMLTHGRSIPVKPILDVAKQYEVLQEISEGSELESAAERLYPTNIPPPPPE